MTTLPDTGRGIPSDLAATGVIVVLGVPADLAAVLTVPGGVPADQLHLTLADLGTTDTIGSARLDAVRSSLARLAARTRALEGSVSGVGRFSAPSGRDAAYVSVSTPDLPAFRESILCELAEGAGLEAEGRHGFTPHVTVAFVAPDEPHPLERIEPRALRFDTLELWVGPRHDVFALQSDGHEPSPCEVTEGAQYALGSVAPTALTAVVSDWEARAVTTLPSWPPDERRGRLHEELDELHTYLLAAHLAAPMRPTGAIDPESRLVERARRIRSVETDLRLILGRAEADLARTLADATASDGAAPDLADRLRDALRPLLAWAVATDESRE